MVNKKENKKFWMDEIEKCPNCGSTHLVRDYERGELVCQDCGLVIDENYIDQGPEWRAFSEEQKEDRARTGAPMSYTIHDKGLSTEISLANKDSYGRSIPSRNRAQVYRLRKWQRRIRITSNMERNLTQALQELERMSSSIGITKDIKESAALIYRKAAKENLVKGRSIESVVGASIYAACRMMNAPRTLEEIAKSAGLKKKVIGKAFRKISVKLKLNLSIQKPEDYIDRFCLKLNLSEKVKEKAIEILKEVEERGLISGKGPNGLAAAAVYIAAVMNNERRTQTEIAEVSCVTEVTIRNRYKEILDKLGFEIDV